MLRMPGRSLATTGSPTAQASTTIPGILSRTEGISRTSAR